VLERDVLNSSLSRNIASTYLTVSSQFEPFFLRQAGRAKSTTRITILKYSQWQSVTKPFSVPGFTNNPATWYVRELQTHCTIGLWSDAHVHDGQAGDGVLWKNSA